MIQDDNVLNDDSFRKSKKFEDLRTCCYRLLMMETAIVNVNSFLSIQVNVDNWH